MANYTTTAHDMIHKNISHGLRNRARMHFLDTLRVGGIWHATTSTKNWLVDNGIDIRHATVYAYMLKDYHLNGGCLA